METTLTAPAETALENKIGRYKRVKITCSPQNQSCCHCYYKSVQYTLLPPYSTFSIIRSNANWKQEEGYPISDSAGQPFSVIFSLYISCNYSIWKLCYLFLPKKWNILDTVLNVKYYINYKIRPQMLDLCWTSLPWQIRQSLSRWGLVFMVFKLLKCVPCLKGQNVCSYLLLQSSGHHRNCQGQKLVCGSHSFLSLNAEKGICSDTCL